VPGLVCAVTTTGRRPRALPPAGIPSWTLWTLAAVAVAAITWALFSRAFLNYDTLYALVWGRDLVHGRLPDYDVTLAPTPHPLATAVAAPLSLLGTDAGYTALLALAMLAFGFLVVGVYVLGHDVFSWPVGLLAAGIVATRVPFLSQAARAYVDIPFLALVVWAAVLEVRRPRRGWPVLALLTLAGLIRPEAWLFAGVYWLYLRPTLSGRTQWKMLALVLSAPVLWAISDLVVSGDLLHSLSGTRDTAATLHRPRGLGDVPETLPRRLGEILRLPALAGGVAGFFLAFYLVRIRALVPLALSVLGGAAFVALGLAGLPLIGRYLFLPATMLAVLFGFAAVGWWGARPERSISSTFRRVWIVGGSALLAAFVAFAPANVRGLDGMRDGVQLRGKIEDDLHSLTTGSAEQLFDSCSPVYVPNHRPVPILAWYLDRRPDEIRSAQLEEPRRGLFLAPATAEVEEKFVLDPNDPKRLDAEVPRTFDRTTGNRSWVLYESGC
jgi:hypothetical protein